MSPNQKHAHALAEAQLMARRSPGWPDDPKRVEADLLTWSRHQPNLQRALARIGARLIAAPLTSEMEI